MAGGWSHLRARSAEVMAMAEIADVGDPEQHWEVGTLAVHLRKRLLDSEIQQMGGVCPHELQEG